MGKTRETRCRWCGQGSPWLVLQSSRTCCRQGLGSSPSPSPGELGGGVFPPSPWSSASLGAAPRLRAPAGAAAGLTCVAVRERCRGGPVPPASAELQQGELVSSFLPFRSSAPSESPALFLTGEDPGSAARPLVLKDREARACAGGEPRGAAQRGGCSGRSGAGTAGHRGRFGSGGTAPVSGREGQEPAPGRGLRPLPTEPPCSAANL